MRVIEKSCPRCHGLLILSFARGDTVIRCNDCEYEEKYQGDRRKENKPIEFQDRRETFFGGL